MPTIQPGARFGRFLVEEARQQDGLGVVVQARDTTRGDVVALRLLEPRPEAERARIRAAAAALASVRHPHVVAILELGTVDGVDYLAMEPMDGEALRAWRRARPAWRVVVELFAQACDGLAALHAAGIVHRAFTPDDIWLDRDGRPAVADAGLAVGAVATPGFAPVLGRPAYLPPEAVRGGALDERGDQFSVCVALYEALWDRHPFDREGEVMTLLQAISRAEVPPPPPSDVPAAIRDTVLRGLAGEPAARHADLTALARALRAA